jgi:RHS repeat-associated protein
VHEWTDDDVAAPTTWVFDPDSDEPAAKLTSDGKNLSIVSDFLGTPEQMIDEAGRLAWKAQLDVYGVPTSDVGSAADCPWRWPGQYHDAETGLYFNRFRYYDPARGDYISQDPIGLGGGTAPYAYAPDPTTWIDLFGLQCKKDKKKRGYTVLFEVQLDAKDFGRSRDVHFNRSNAALARAMEADPALRAKMEAQIPGVSAAVSRTGGREDPPGFTWHHATTAQGGGKPGVMQLVPTAEHTPGSPQWRALHPDPGASGGYSEWAIPAGAPKN